MNIKITSIMIAALLLTGCVKEQLIKTVYVEKKVPVNAVPAPPDIVPPVYETSKLTPEDREDIGIVTQAVTVESKQKEGYIKILETVVAEYKRLADESEVRLPPLTLPENKGTVSVGEPETIVNDGHPKP